MSIIQLFIVFFVVAFCSVCNTGANKSFIPGQYVQYSELKHDEDSYTRLFDTLELQRAGKVYRVTRRYRTFKTVDGKALEPEYKVRRWTGEYREETGTLLVNERGRVISFYSDSNTIMMGGVIYKKIERSYEAVSHLYPVNAWDGE